MLGKILKDDGTWYYIEFIYNYGPVFDYDLDNNGLGGWAGIYEFTPAGMRGWIREDGINFIAASHEHFSYKLKALNGELDVQVQ